MKKLLALVLAVLMIATVLVACGGGQTTTTTGTGSDGGADLSDLGGEDNVTLLVWAPENAVALTTELCNDFIAQYPDKSITIDVKPMEEGEVSGQILNDPSVAADVFSFACDQLLQLDKAKVLAPLDDYVDVVDGRDAKPAVEAATLNGTLLAFPETGENGYYLAYDKSVVSDEDAKTFEGVLEACRKAGKKFNMDGGNGFYSCMFPFTGGLEITGVEDGVQQFNDYDEEKVVDALEAFYNLFQEYSDVFQSDNVDKTGSGMATGGVAAGIDGAWNAATVSKALGDNYGAVKLPTINIKGTDTQIISMNGYKFIGVNDLSSFPYTAQALGNYLADEACQLKRAEDLSWSPSNLTVQQSDVIAKNVGSLACLDQANYSLPQVLSNTKFYGPMGTLGNYMIKNTGLSRDDLKAEFDKAITNIKDE
ncbi:MAG: extracellular solute-binding protein [Ruminococcus sp.]|nr:extracellular solute-binding protein [Ruminococcus sp.]MBR0303981.1 extracellular solute-binding protein [Clostridia bacterium]